MDELDLAERLVAVEERAKSNTKRIDELQHQQRDLANIVTSVELIAQKQSSMEENLGEMKNDIRQLAEKPAKRWDGVVEKIIATIVGAVVAFLLAKAGII